MFRFGARADVRQTRSGGSRPSAPSRPIRRIVRAHWQREGFELLFQRFDTPSQARRTWPLCEAPHSIAAPLRRNLHPLHTREGGLHAQSSAFCRGDHRRGRGGGRDDAWRACDRSAGVPRRPPARNHLLAAPWLIHGRLNHGRLPASGIDAAGPVRLLLTAQRDLSKVFPAKQKTLRSAHFDARSVLHRVVPHCDAR